MHTDYDVINGIISTSGLQVRGAFYPIQEDEVPAICRNITANTLVLVGNIGGKMWPYFERHKIDENDSLDNWTKRVTQSFTSQLRKNYGNAKLFFPSEGPPYLPFQRWAMRAESVFPSPLGILIHPKHGLWHAYRAAIAFEKVLSIPNKKDIQSPCSTCKGKPCLKACPVNAFSDGSYDVGACVSYLNTDSGDQCLSIGCLARKACPISKTSGYNEAQSRFHMRSMKDKHVN